MLRGMRHKESQSECSCGRRGYAYGRRVDHRATIKHGWISGGDRRGRARRRTNQLQSVSDLWEQEGDQSVCGDREERSTRLHTIPRDWMNHRLVSKSFQPQSRKTSSPFSGANLNKYTSIRLSVLHTDQSRGTHILDLDPFRKLSAPPFDLDLETAGESAEAVPNITDRSPKLDQRRLGLVMTKSETLLRGRRGVHLTGICTDG